MLQFHPSGFIQKTVNTHLGKMAYYTQDQAFWGEVNNQPTMLFLHNFGGGASAYEWSKVYPAFAAEYRIIAPDLIGWGASDRPQRNYQIEDYLTTITEFIEQTCPQQSISVVASSWTAALTVRLAIQNPKIFQRLFLVCPSGFADFGQDAGRRLPKGLISLPIIDDLLYSLGAENELAVGNFLRSFLFRNPDRLSPEIIAAYLSSAQQPNGKFAALAFLRGDLYFDLSLYLRQLQTPTVIFWGEEAQFTDINLGRRLAELNPGVIKKFWPIASTGILPHLETPAVFIGLLQKSIAILSD